MITIAGGELLSSLGSKPDRIAALRAGSIHSTTMCIEGMADQPIFPCYRIDETQRVALVDHIEEYLISVTKALLRKIFPKCSPPSDIGLFLGSSSLDYSLTRPMELNIDGLDPQDCPCRRVGGGFYAERLMQRFGFTGPSLTFNTACTSSINALMEAALMLECRIIDHALVLGFELSLPLIVEGFAMMHLLSPDILRPFSRNRNGMVLGEAVSAVLLSRDDIYPADWYYLGGESSCETYSIIGTDPGGKGIEKVIRHSMATTGTDPSEITVIKSHGIGGDLMDFAEMRGMERAFDEIPPYFSLKPYIGHTLGGCGVAELVLLMDCVDNGFIPATPNALPLDDRFSVAPLTENMDITHGRFMLNYFGFGGNNTSCIVKKYAP